MAFFAEIVQSLSSMSPAFGGGADPGKRPGLVALSLRFAKRPVRWPRGSAAAEGESGPPPNRGRRALRQAGAGVTAAGSREDAFIPSGSPEGPARAECARERVRDGAGEPGALGRSLLILDRLEPARIGEEGEEVVSPAAGLLPQRPQGGLEGASVGKAGRKAGHGPIPKKSRRIVPFEALQCAGGSPQGRKQRLHDALPSGAALPRAAPPDGAQLSCQFREGASGDAPVARQLLAR